MAVSFAVASRALLLSMMSGMAKDGEDGELTVTYMACPSFTFVPKPGLCANMQSAGNLLL